MPQKKLYRIAFDLDGVILNFSKGFKKYCANLLPPIEISDNPPDWTYGLGDDIMPPLKGFFSSEEIGKLELMDPEWPDFLKFLDEKYETIFSNVEYDFLTEFPLNAVKAREENLRNLGLKSINLIVVQDKVHFINSNPNRYSLIVDDKPAFIDALHTTQNIIAPRWNYNYEQASKIRAYSNFDSLRNMILKDIALDV